MNSITTIMNLSWCYWSEISPRWNFYYLVPLAGRILLGLENTTGGTACIFSQLCSIFITVYFTFYFFCSPNKFDTPLNRFFFAVKCGVFFWKQTEKRSSTKRSELQRIRERRGSKSCLIWVFSSAKVQKNSNLFYQSSFETSFSS